MYIPEKITTIKNTQNLNFLNEVTVQCSMYSKEADGGKVETACTGALLYGPRGQNEALQLWLLLTGGIGSPIMHHLRPSPLAYQQALCLRSGLGSMHCCTSPYKGYIS